MRQRVSVLVLVLAVLAGALLSGCGGNPRAVELLARADSLMNGRTDSALTVLDSLLADADHLSRRQEMRCRLLRMNAINKLDTVFTAAHSTQAQTLADYFDRHGTPNEQMLAHYILGRTYADQGETPRAVDCYLDAVAKADTTSADCDYAALGRVYSQMASLFHQQLLLSNEVHARQQAICCFLCAKDTFLAIYHQGMITGNYILMNKRDSAEILLRETMRQYRAHGYEQEALQFSTSLMYLYVDQPDRQAELKQLIEVFDSGLALFNEHRELPPSKRQFYYYKGKYYEGINRLDSAEYYYRKVYAPNMPYLAKNPMYEGLLRVFRKRQIADSIAKYSILYCETNDSSIAVKDQQLTAQMTASYKYNSIQKEALDNKSKAYSFLVMLVLSGIIIAILVLAGFYAYNQFRKKREEQIRLHEQEMHQLKLEFADATESYEDNLHELRLLEKSRKKVISIIQDEINGLNKENEAYKTKLAESQCTIAKINEEYERNSVRLAEENQELKNKIDELKSREGISEYLTASGQFAETGIVKRVKIMAGEPLTQMTQDQWESLYKVFFEHYPALCHDLIRQNFNTNTVRVCMLTVIGIRNNEQSNLIGIKKQIVTNCKTNINSILFNEKTSRTLYKNLVSQYNIYSL